MQPPGHLGNGNGDDAIRELELEGMRQVFDQFDEDKSGSIDAEELYKVMKFLGHEMSESQVMELLSQVDVDNNGTVEFDEFKQMLLLYKEAARFKLTEDNGIRVELLKVRANNYPTDLLGVALWQILAVIFALYYWMAVLYTDTLPSDDEADALMRDQLGVEVIGTLVILIDMCVSARINDATDTGSFISKSYLKLWLVPDCLTVLPWHLMVGAGLTQRVLYHFKLLRLIRAFLSYWSESRRVHATRNYVTLHFFIIPLVKSMIAFVAFVQLAAIVYSAVMNDGTYLKALYVVTYAVTGVGLGTMTNTTVSERLYATFLCFVAQALSATVVGRIATMVMQSDITALKHHEVSHALAVAKLGKLPRALVHDIVGYREHCVEDSLSEAYKELISNLPVALQGNITLFVKLRMIQNTKLFETAHRSTQVAIARELEALIFRPREVLFYAGESVSSLFLIAYGYITLVDAHGNPFKTLRAGDCVGENGLVFGIEQSTFTGVAVNYCEVYLLTCQSFQWVLRRFPLFRSKIEALASVRRAALEEEIKTSLGRKDVSTSALLDTDPSTDEKFVGSHAAPADERLSLQKCLVEMQEIEDIVSVLEEKGIDVHVNEELMTSASTLLVSSAARIAANVSLSDRAALGFAMGAAGTPKPHATPSGHPQQQPHANAATPDMLVEDTMSVEGDHEVLDDFKAFAEASDGEEVMSSGFPSGTNIVEGSFGVHGHMSNLPQHGPGHFAAGSFSPPTTGTNLAGVPSPVMTAVGGGAGNASGSGTSATHTTFGAPATGASGANGAGPEIKKRRKVRSNSGEAPTASAIPRGHHGDEHDDDVVVEDAYDDDVTSSVDV